MKPSGKISNVVLWSVISAAFIGPGTITTAITAGSLFQIQLIWAVVFATLACILLQEVSARITIASGLTFGQVLAKRYGNAGAWIKWTVALPVLLGCAAYEAGNILGAVSGISLLAEGDGQIYTVIITVAVGLVLWRGGSRTISLIMTALVGMMGIAFLVLAFQTHFSFSELFRAAVIPELPQGSEWIALALLGTTIVPYNIFIGSAISKGHTIPLMRVGLTISVVIGGLITCWIMIAGSLTTGFSTFAELATSLQDQLGVAGGWALGIGLFAAGFSSSITSPYAASLIASTVLESKNIRVTRGVWMLVLLIGFIFGFSGVKPIPVILTVQALNGFVLPLLTYFLILLVNDRKVIPTANQHGLVYNLFLLSIFGITLLIGLNNVDKAITGGFQLSTDHFEVVLIVTGVTLAYMGLELWKIKKAG